MLGGSGRIFVAELGVFVVDLRDSEAIRAFASWKVMSIHGNRHRILHILYGITIPIGSMVSWPTSSWILMVFMWIFRLIWCTPPGKLGNRTHLIWLDTSSPLKSHKVGPRPHGETSSVVANTNILAWPLKSSENFSWILFWGCLLCRVWFFGLSVFFL